MATAKSRSKPEREPPKEGEELPAATVAGQARDQIGELTGKEVVGVTSVQPVEEGWLVEVEVLEERRIPSTSDMLALFEVEMDFDGNLLAYRRTKRYPRGRVDGSRS
jgi:hypothetical protein